MSDYLFLRKNDRHVKIKTGDIQFIEAAGSYLKVNTITEQFSLAQNLSQFERKNPIRALVRVHRSFMVNFDLVDSFDNGHVYIGEIQIPIGPSFRNNFLKSVSSSVPIDDLE